MLTLGNAEMRPLVEFSCDGLAVGLESRMRTDTVQVTASLQVNYQRFKDVI